MIAKNFFKDLELEPNVKLNDITLTGSISNYNWSKFYYYRKRYGKLTALILFLPALLRIIFRICLNTISGNKVTKSKYQIRLNGLINSIKNNKSFKRIEDF